MKLRPIGTQYTDRHGRQCTIVDIHTTTNAAGETVRDKDVLPTTVEKRLAGQ